MRLLPEVSALLRRIFVVSKEKKRFRVFPTSFFRGVANESDVENGVYLKSSAFQFGEVPSNREDGNRELSIVWNDCKDALHTLLKQPNKKGTGPQFACGYATIKLSKFESTLITYIASNMVGYERRPIKGDKETGIQDNPYHGNVLLHGRASEQLKKNIQHSLATIAEFTRRS